jgi:branched-chain amino acid transport system permease protein
LETTRVVPGAGLRATSDDGVGTNFGFDGQIVLGKSFVSFLIGCRFTCKAEQMNRKRFLLSLLWLLLALFPWAMQSLGQEFYITLGTRMMIFALAASSLNLLLGYGGLVSFGHAAYFGVGAYVVAILGQNAVTSAWVAWPLAVLFCGLLALLIGAVSLRTRGVYFIMITLAFAQMIYFVVISLKQYGGEDGLAMRRSTLGLGLDLKNDVAFYYVVLLMLTGALFLLARIVNARFGHVLQAIRTNEVRMTALGYPVYRYQLVCFVISGALAGLAGVLNANLNVFASPNLLAWQQSGHLLMMVILGGVGHFWGGALGAVVYLWLEDSLSDLTIHWQLGVGLILLLIVLLAPQGLAGMLSKMRPRPLAPVKKVSTP